MIVVDTSALMAMLLGEPESGACAERMKNEASILICAGTLNEALVVASLRGLLSEMNALLAGWEVAPISLTEQRARAAAEAYQRWGKGLHPARLNLADCYAYALAAEHDCPLLYVGDDFSQTDIEAALA